MARRSRRALTTLPDTHGREYQSLFLDQKWEDEVLHHAERGERERERWIKENEKRNSREQRKRDPVSKGRRYRVLR